MQSIPFSGAVLIEISAGLLKHDHCLYAAAVFVFAFIPASGFRMLFLYRPLPTAH
jgi:hypothetical protein